MRRDIGSKAAARYGVPEAAQLVGLWGVAVAQPLYDLLTRTPEFFAVRGTSFGEAVLFAFGLSWLAPSLLVGLCLAAGLLGRTLRFALHGLLVAALVAVLALAVGSGMPLSAPALLTGSLALGALVAWALQRWTPLRTWGALLALSAIVFPVVFFVRTPMATWGEAGASGTWDVPSPRSPAPIVFVVLDELPLVSLLGRNGEIDARSFPNFAALSRQANWYPRATTMSDFTMLAIPALLTGRVPVQGQLPNLAHHPDNLFSLLASHYEISAQESLTRLCPPRVCAQEEEDVWPRLRGLVRDLALVYPHIVLPPVWTASLPPVDQTWMDFGAAEPLSAEARAVERQYLRQFREVASGNRAADFLRFLVRLEPREQPALHFYASHLPHVPFDYLPSGRLYSVDGNPAGMVGPGQWGDDEWAVMQDHQRFQLQVGFVDRQLGLLLRRLREIELYDSALLIVTADHGVSFRVGGMRRAITSKNFAEIAAVPLFVKLPGQRQGRREDRTVELVDVLPTILDVVGIDAPPGVQLDGQSLLGPTTPGRTHRVIPKYRQPAAMERITTSELQRGLEEGVDLKIDRFGSEAFSARFYQLGDYGHLVGQKVAELEPLPASGIETSFVLAVADGDFDPDRGYVPAHIRGSSRPPGGDQPRHLAVAVNGTIHAVTRTWKASSRFRAGDWSAVVDEAAFVPGANTIEVFHLRPTAEGVQVARTDGVALSPAAGTLPLGGQPVLGVAEAGFHAREQRGVGKPSRWSDGHARLEIPVSDDRAPRAVRIVLGATGPQGTRLRVLLDGEVAYRAKLPPGGWEGEVPLRQSPRSDVLVVEIVSDTFVPAEVTAGSRDTRRLGVAVEEVRLLDTSAGR